MDKKISFFLLLPLSLSLNEIFAHYQHLISKIGKFPNVDIFRGKHLRVKYNLRL